VAATKSVETLDVFIRMTALVRAQPRFLFRRKLPKLNMKQ